MPLAPSELLAAVATSNATGAGGLDRLTFDYATAGRVVASDVDAESLPEGGMDTLLSAVQSPEPETLIDGLPRLELVRYESPLASTSDNVEHRVQYLEEGVSSGPPDGFDQSQITLDTRVLFDLAIGGLGRLVMPTTGTHQEPAHTHTVSSQA